MILIKLLFFYGMTLYIFNFQIRRNLKNLFKYLNYNNIIDCNGLYLSFSSVKKNIWAVKLLRFENSHSIILKNINFTKNVDLLILTKIYDKSTNWTIEQK